MKAGRESRTAVMAHAVRALRRLRIAVADRADGAERPA